MLASNATTVSRLRAKKHLARRMGISSVLGCGCHRTATRRAIANVRSRLLGSVAAGISWSGLICVVIVFPVVWHPLGLVGFGLLLVGKLLMRVSGDGMRRRLIARTEMAEIYGYEA